MNGEPAVGIVHKVYGTICCQDQMCAIGGSGRTRGTLGMAEQDKQAKCLHVQAMVEAEELWVDFAVEQNRNAHNDREYELVTNINREDAGLQLAFEERPRDKMFNSLTGMWDFGGISQHVHMDREIMQRYVHIYHSFIDNKRLDFV